MGNEKYGNEITVPFDPSAPASHQHWLQKQYELEIRSKKVIPKEFIAERKMTIDKYWPIKDGEDIWDKRTGELVRKEVMKRKKAKQDRVKHKG